MYVTKDLHAEHSLIAQHNSMIDN